jgi:hypothetical protein
MNKMKSLHFTVKGVGGLSLIFSEVVIVIMFAMVSGIISLLSVLVSFVSRFCFLVSRYQVLSKSEFQGIGFVKVSWCQGVRVRCKDTGVFVGESTLLLDFKTFKAKHFNSLNFQCFARMWRMDFVYQVK